MAHKNLVGGTSYDTKGGRTLVNGTGYGIKKGRTLMKGTGYDINFVSYDPVFANNDWSEIIEACQTRNVPSTWTVYSQKAMTINGKEYPIDIIGLGQDDYADGSGKAPITLQMHDCYDTTYQMNSTASTSGSWPNCEMKTIHLPAILALMPSNVQSAIRDVTKDTDGVLSTDKLFLLSREESDAGGYRYYNGGSSYRVKNLNGSAQTWWTRSVRDSTKFWCRLSASGSASNVSATSRLGVSFAFCF